MENFDALQTLQVNESRLLGPPAVTLTKKLI